MDTAIAAVLGLVEEILPLITAGGKVGSVISMLETVVPLIAKGAAALYQPVKNILAALQSDGSVTPAQALQLQALDQQVDAAFDAATAGLDPDAPATS